MRRRIFGKVENKNYDGIETTNAVSGDVCLFNITTQKLIIVPNDIFDGKNFPLKYFSPVGVVAVPGTHDVYGDGSCGVVSLKEMDCNTPDTGVAYHSSTRIYWGCNTYDTSLTNYTGVPNIAYSDYVNDEIVGFQEDWSYLPSDKFDGIQCPHDSDAKYDFKSGADSMYRFIPSPYCEDNTRNILYYTKSSPSSSTNALRDFNGKNNTTKLCSLATSQSNWKTATTITNSYSNGYYPAACCCWRYHTDGTSQGDWYLPASGEFGYVISRFNKINTAITLLKTNYGDDSCIELNDDLYYCGSTEYSETKCSFFRTDNGAISLSYKSTDYPVRAFLRV